MKTELFLLLPDEIVDLIWQKLSPVCLVLLDKGLFARHHHVLSKGVPRKRVEAWYRSMIRHDASFVLGQAISDDWTYIAREREYRYGGATYGNYIQFILEFCHANGASRCEQMIRTICGNTGWKLNQHKKNRVRNIRWTN